MSRKSRKQAQKNFYEQQIGEVYKIQMDFLRDAIKYMFYANGFAITGVLIKYDIQTYKLPIFIFAFGIAYTLIIPIFMSAYTKYTILQSFKHKCSPFDTKSYKYCDIFMRLITMILVYVPILIFLYGLLVTFNIILDIPVLCPLELLNKLIEEVVLK